MRGMVVNIAVAAIFGITAAYFLFKWYVLVVVLLYFLYMYYIKKKKLLCLICITISVSFSYYYFIYDQLNVSTISIERAPLSVIGEIISKPYINGDRLTYTFKLEEFNEKVQFTYKIKTKQELKVLEKLEIGDVCSFQDGNFIKPPQARNYYAFDYRLYLYRQNIHWMYEPTTFYNWNCVNVNSKDPVVFLKQIRSKGIDLIEDKFPQPTSGIVQALVFGERKYIEENVVNAYQALGLIHLLAISGLHVGFLTGIIFYIGIRINISRETMTNILLTILPMYIIIAGASPSVLRACLMTILVILSLKVRSFIHPLDSISIVAFLLLCYRPYYVFEAGFQLSFIVSFVLITSSTTILKQVSRSKQLLYVTVVAQLSSFPIILFHFYEISFISIFLNFIYVPFVSILILPLSLISTLMAWLMPEFIFLSSILIFFIDLSTQILEKVKPYSLMVSLKKPSILYVLLYYIAITYLFVCWEKAGAFSRLYIPLVVLICLLSIHWCLPYLNNNGEVTVIDVGQGDSILIELPNRKGVYLIDTGGYVQFNKERWQRKQNNFEVGKDTIAPLLKAKGIRKIDKLIITHGDFDHIGGAESLMKIFHIEEVIIGEKQEIAELEKFIISLAIKNGTKVTKVKRGMGWSAQEHKFFVLSPFGDEFTDNNQSIVLYAFLGNTTWLFTGDLEKEGEDRLLRTYPNLQANILKVGHHGSNTSTSEHFLNKVKPKVAIISAGEKNRFGHPHPEVVDRLSDKQIKILRTDKHGSIRFIFNKKGGTFELKVP